MGYINEATNFDREHADMLVDMVMDFFSSQRPSSKSEEYKPILDQFDIIKDYKKQQVENLMEGSETYTFRDIVMYLSCPLNVKSKEEISNFGIRMPENPGNGTLNEFLTRSIIKNAIIMDGVPDSNEVDDKPLTLIDTNDLLENMASSMLTNRALLIYLYMTGKGKEFTELFGNIEILKKIEAGTIKEDELVDACPKEDEFLSVDQELDSDYLRILNSDLKFIKDEMQPKGFGGHSANILR